MFAAIFLSYPCMFVVGFIIVPIFKGTFLEKLFDKLMENTVVSVIFFYLLGLALAYFIFNAYYKGAPDIYEEPTRHVGPFEY